MKPATRPERAQALAAAAGCRAAGQSERAVAATVGRPCSTLRDWAQAEVASAEVPEALAAFFASVKGVQWLHRLVLAIQFVITLRAGGGVRLVCECLELSGLSAFVGASYGSQQGLNAALEQAVVAIAAERRGALAAGMAPRAVTVFEDESFHPEICLVVVEPVSGFIVLEHYAADRTAVTWTQALSAACAGLTITVIQGTTDETAVRAADAEVASAEARSWSTHAPPSRHIARNATDPGSPPASASRIRHALTTWARVAAVGSR